MAKSRLTVKEVEDILYAAEHERIMPTASQVRRLCDSHEVYRGFAQRFIDIYSGRATTLHSGGTTGLNANDPDNQQVLLFQLFLEIVGPIAPKV